MAKNLVIVESPAKAKTIEGYLGKDFTVKSSFGHVRDLVKTGMGININNNFEPVYEVSPDKSNVIKDLIKLASTAEVVWLATDEDREGEAISWHLYETLKLKGKETKRIVFHEITKKAILNAIDSPRTIDMNLVNAQQARRVLDRLVGFELSPVLWKKVRPSLSAGRVQSVSVRLIVEREREIEAHKSVSSFKVVGIFTTNNKSFKAELPKRFETAAAAEKFLNELKGATFNVQGKEVKPGKRSPSAPFTTSTLQQEAARKLGYSVSQTMLLAQKLYEAGKISYMRTDSVNLSQDALNMASSVITKNYGREFVNTRQYKTKTASAQEAHEAIRPTEMADEIASADQREQRLYDLIRKRTLASQMADAKLEKTIITISNDKNKENLIATGEVIIFEGFLKVYLEGTDEENTDEEDSGLLPIMQQGDQVLLQQLTATERFSAPPARYTEAALVKKLEELGIGRPSTYAPTISTVQKRGYVIKEDRQGRERHYTQFTLSDNQVKSEKKTEITGAEKAKMFPTDIGTLVTDFLVANFKEILDYNFTAYVEKEFDDIANGMLKWNNMIKEFYDPFHKTVEVTEKESERVTGERILGKDPVSGLTLLVRVGRYGPMAQIGAQDETDKPKYAKLRTNQRLETITAEEAIDLFKLPRNLGAFEAEDLVVSIGRFGPYVRHGSLFASLKKEDDPYEIAFDRAVELVVEKRKTNLERTLKTFDEEPTIQVLKGRWGPFVSYKGKNLRIPKGTEVATLELSTIHELAEQQGLVKKPKAKATKTAKVVALASLPKAASTRKVASAAPAKTKSPAKKAAPKKKAPAKGVAKKAVAKKKK